MPLFDMVCNNGHHREMFAHTVEKAKGRGIAEGCDACGYALVPGFSMGRGLTYFSQKGGGRVIHNLGPQPVTITSTAQHERIMKEQGVAWAPSRRGMKGCW